MSWYVIYGEAENGPCGLTIGPHEDDHADAFAFSMNFPSADGIPDEVQKKFDLMAAAPDLLAACKAALLTRACDKATRNMLRNAIAKAEPLK